MEDVSMRRRLGTSSSNPPEAASSPSAEDQSKSRPRAQEDTAEKTTTADQRGVARGSADRGSGKGQGETAAIADGGASTAAGATVNPFWSERAKREAQLVAARPDFLGGVAGQTSRGPSSTSTEMRPSEETPAATGSTGPEYPAGAPVSFGPPAAVQTTVGEQDAAGTGQPAGEPGLRPAERQVLTEMKGILEMLVAQNTELREQNAGLQSRLEKLEEDRSAAWRSVASGGVQEGAEQPGLMLMMISLTRGRVWILLGWEQALEGIRLYQVYAPGGLQERTQILGELTNLGVARSASEAVQALRSWNRTYARARTMGVSVPDPALVLRGLDALTEGLLRKAVHAQVSFRVSTARNHLRLDHNPTMGSVMEFLKVLQSEWEQVSVSGQEETPKPPKGKNLKGKGRDEKGNYGGGKAPDAQPSAGGQWYQAEFELATVGPRHFRQRHRHANALTLNLDLIGPWTAGDDHALAGPARHILVATLGVPILKDGRPLPLEKEKEGEEKEREEGNEDEGRGVAPIDTGDEDRQLVLEDPESREESEEGELSPEEYAALYERQEAKWREIAKDLQEPVQVHEVLFAEPLRSKRSEEVLRGIQRIYSKITVMNLSVRRFHVAPVVYAGVRDPIKFVGDVDGEDCRSLCLPPILYHRRQNLCLTARKLKRKEAGEQVEILPAKAIFQRKGADIRTAFLLAPLRQHQKRTVLRPPSVLVQAGFAAPGEYWEITGALYGLQTSPADWAIYRDETLPTLEVWCDDQKTHLQRSKYDPNLWLLYCPKTSKLIAALTIYVDDLLLSGTPEASQAVWEAIKAKWKISEPEYADQGVVTFCGFEIRQQPDGIHVGQAKYVQSLLDKYSEVLGTASCPYARESEVIDAKPQESIDKLRRAQALAGELLWLATRTRPDLAFGVSRIGQLITKDVDQALRRGEEMIKYLRATKQQELIYGEPGQGHGTADQLPIARDFNLIEVFADASFCPGTDRS
ncbi:putative transposon protein [Symbiodinium microadriaticum]|uniref:Putative transposon protein n=1 Tax=Symbiodinium microadriaticum TaxID=2951 RepID=A0A1Q9CTC7_SYMMI|nr:putative transposon protein [Symbiodinium microadriaticum]CAE7201986.1 RE1 [Symbiodinium sp. KB8]CAE7889170.1 RE1 [Symbiodinium microadriaticum]